MKRLLVIAILAAVLLLPMLGGASPTAVNAQSGNTWTAAYFNNPNWAGNPVLTQTVPFISFNWGYGSPGAGVPVDNFTARFDSQVFFNAGTTRFTLQADDEVALIINGVTFLDTRGAGQSGKTLTVDVPLNQGWQPVQVLYREFTQTASVFVTWQLVKPGTNPTPPPPPPPPPANNCGPTSASSVQTNFGNYTPCIQQGIHQVNCFQSDGAWNSPNRGSIETEPQIQVWGNCTADSWTEFQVSCDPTVPKQSYKCSKTEAGWFPG
ncbi:MAG: hypothetical protein KDI03_12655 [Anaerolineae bacterium]|nr:hypothetical protein [Anaerolineae bacterium]